MRRIVTILAMAGLLAGCGSAPPATPAGPFDPQTLVGRWQGEWRTLRHQGPAILDVSAVRGREVVGRLNLVGYVVQYEGRTGREIEVAGTLTERGGAVTLALTSALPPLTLRVSGSRMEGRAAEGVADLLTTLTLEKVR